MKRINEILRNSAFLIALFILASVIQAEAMGREVLKGEGNEVFTKFQKTIKDSKWNEALEYCSDKVNAKARDYNSPKTFFEATLPIEKITALKKFEIWGWSEDKQYYCEIPIKDPNYKWPLHWQLEVCKQENTWVMEFPTKPLKIWLKDAVLTSKVVNRELKVDWEKVRTGYGYILTPLAERFAIGRPMEFRIEMKNISNESLPYMKKPMTVNGPMIITGPNGEKIEYLAGPCQIGEATDFTEPNEIVLLADNYDAGNDYRIVRPGKYAFQFRGDYGVLSNKVEIEVGNGKLSDIDIIIEKLKPILPADWEFARNRFDKNISVAMYKKGMIKNPNGSVIIALYFNPTEDFLQKVQEELKPWGQTQWGTIYIKSENIEKYWPEYKEQIKKALEIEEKN